MREIERRAAGALELRAKGEGREIVGYAAVFNSKSEDMGFREIILPGAFDRALKEKHDVRALVDHDGGKILGRTKSGTLTLEVDEHGLLSRITPPDTQVARDTLTLLDRGDLDGMSFAFRVKDDGFRTEGDEIIREIRDLDLVDVSVVAFPAYPATSVSARVAEQVAECRSMLEKAKVPEPGVPNDVNARRMAHEAAQRKLAE